MFPEHEHFLDKFAIFYMYECKSIFCFTFSNPLSNRILDLLIRCNFSLSCKVYLLSVCYLVCMSVC